MVKIPAPEFRVTVGTAVSVSDPVPVFVTVMVLFFTALVAGFVVIAGLGAEKLTTA